jgi:hypothetical protein
MFENFTQATLCPNFYSKYSHKSLPKKEISKAVDPLYTCLRLATHHIFSVTLNDTVYALGETVSPISLRVM